MEPRRWRVTDWDRAHGLAQETYFPHRLRVRERYRPDFRLQAVDLGPVLIGRIGWGGEVAIDCAYEGSVEVNAPLSGLLEWQGGGQRLASTAGQASVFAADEQQPITRWSRDCEVLGVKFDVRWLGDRARAGFGATGPLLLPRQLDLRRGPLAEWWRLVRSLHAAGVSNPAVADSLADAVTTSFLLCVLPDERESGGGVGSVQRVVDALGDAPERDWTAADMAAFAGVSVRRMQELFAAELGLTPRQVLQEMRLDRARTDLRRGDDTVAEVAATWGFTNPGRFAAAYRKRFGCPPSLEARAGQILGR
ncbi:AraC family transcriptional regulator [Enemella dayhoffiae]|uniref:AraC family transcriptional regulator n=1 Tax=Enemella dayhoffiae TaxID=2016507 RepID=A0A255H114_9ACTN|nr:AraC family transcriptional regulator [Enemella dayhoffiae]OYO20973.1 AraC family transcriptional regulator [Enemella dayhoffiae]